MPPSKRYAVPPTESTGFAIFVRTAYPAPYNFAVSNHNAVSSVQKKTMRGGHLLLFRSVAAVCWIISMAFAILALLKGTMVIGTVIISGLYLFLTCYNIYVYFDNRSLLSATRLLKAKVAGPSGQPYDWVNVPLDSRSANERLAVVDQAALDSVRRDFGGGAQNEIDCLVYTKRYADLYTSFPKEALLHFIAHVLAICIGIALAFV